MGSGNIRECCAGEEAIHEGAGAGEDLGKGGGGGELCFVGEKTGL